jgi:inner membrane protein
VPSAFTHALCGAALSTFAPRRTRGVVVAMTLASIAALPDLDFVGMMFCIPYAHPLGHRGFTHSLTFAALVAAIVAFSLRRRGTVSMRTTTGLFLVAFLACASHGFLDAFTDAGLGVGFFIPFSNRRFFFPWRPVATSPLSVHAFFSGAGLRILANEMFWIWLPVGLLLAIVAWIARWRTSGKKILNHRGTERTESESEKSVGVVDGPRD